MLIPKQSIVTTCNPIDVAVCNGFITELLVLQIIMSNEKTLPVQNLLIEIAQVYKRLTPSCSNIFSKNATRQ